ncbi:hypothetical protein [Kutzneria sp. 744]|uniref:hypothetical protein n=1 Tax=Kutzneria sp. (strain 744) TaxID=345341 RepID=UPI0003EEBB8A|nr:hypothetical protein [Kutzneria sp. 744]EWM12152.1 sulfonate/nitrate/taurine transporter ATP-binding protein [Kutzneria sp. 744]
MGDGEIGEADQHEPFSALDVLTAENLRTELMSLWHQEILPTKGICIVTHNIEEAVQPADRVLVLGANPGHIRSEVTVDPARSRDRKAARQPNDWHAPPPRYRLLAVIPGVADPGRRQDHRHVSVLTLRNLSNAARRDACRFTPAFCG